MINEIVRMKSMMMSNRSPKSLGVNRQKLFALKAHQGHDD